MYKKKDGLEINIHYLHHIRQIFFAVFSQRKSSLRSLYARNQTYDLRPTTLPILALVVANLKQIAFKVVPSYLPDHSLKLKPFLPLSL